MRARTLRRTGKRVASTLEDVSDKITEVADPVREETEKAGGDSARTRSIGAARGVASRSTLLRRLAIGSAPSVPTSPARHSAGATIRLARHATDELAVWLIPPWPSTVIQ